MTKRLMVCPGCRRRGITLRLRVNDDYWACRYCGWSVHVTTAYDLRDRILRQNLADMNPAHPDKPLDEIPLET